MFEMFITIVAAIAATLFGLSQTVFMKGPYRHYYQAGALAFILLLILIYTIYHSIKKNRIKKLNINPDDYYYYDKFTSILYRLGYFISYLIQNILFDYNYMRRNFNFCKGLDVYDGGVSEYYIKFRNTWYRYLNLTLTRHRVSLKKLQQFACHKKNLMIIDAIEDPASGQMFPDVEGSPLKRHYKEFSKMAIDFTKEKWFMNDGVLRSFPYYDEIHPMFRRNLVKICTSMVYVHKHEPKIIDMVNRQEARGRQDVDDYKKMS